MVMANQISKSSMATTRRVASDDSITLSPIDGGRLRSPSGTLAIAAPIEQHGHALDLALVPGGD
jgi:hypothetical protein